MRITERLYLTEDRKRIVKENDHTGRYLFAVPGDDISDAEAIKYGLMEKKADPVPNMNVHYIPPDKRVKEVETKAEEPKEDYKTDENIGKTRGLVINDATESE